MDSKKLLRTLTVNKGQILGPIIDAYQAKGKFPAKWNVEIRNGKEWDPHFHPSGDCFATIEQLYLDKTGQLKNRPISGQMRRTFDIGHLWHGYLQETLIEMGLVARENVERPLFKEIHRVDDKKFYGKGTADLVDVHIPGHGYWLVDIKTMNKDSFGAPNEELMKKYFAQVNMYGDWLGTDKMLILAVCKDSPHEFREFIVPRDEATLGEVYERWQLVSEYIAAGIDPTKLSEL